MSSLPSPLSTPAAEVYLTRAQAMGRLGFTNRDGWYRAVRAGLIAGVERRGEGPRPRFVYRAADLAYAGTIRQVPTIIQRRDALRAERALAARPAEGWTNPFLQSRKAVA